MGAGIVIICYVIPTKCTSNRVFFNLITALHISGLVTTHPQEHKATASTESGKYYTVLLSAAIVETLAFPNIPRYQHITERYNVYQVL
jgi:hypothetical protein